MRALRCENVYKIFGRDSKKALKMLKEGAQRSALPEGVTVAVEDVSLDVNEGEIFVVMGLSGSGKSTLLRTLNALGPATDGKIYVGDQEVTNMPMGEIRRLREQHMSMVFQHFGLLPHRTVLDNAAYPLEIQGVGKQEREQKALEALKTTGLEGRENAYPDELSGGMQQRVGLARALTADADILLMDEAFSALDPLIRRDMQDLLLELQSQKKRTIIFITHDLNEAMYVGDRIAVMKDGKIEQVGTAEEILTSPANDYIARFVQDVDRTRVITASSLMRQPGTRIFTADGPRVALKKLEEWDEEGGWVTDSGTLRLRGMIHTEDVAHALHKNPELRSTESILRHEFYQVGPDTPLSEIISMAANTDITIPVVDEDNKLLGIIPRVAIVVALAAQGDSDAGGTTTDNTAETGGTPAAEGPSETSGAAAEGAFETSGAPAAENTAETEGVTTQLNGKPRQEQEIEQELSNGKENN